MKIDYGIKNRDRTEKGGDVNAEKDSYNGLVPSGPGEMLEKKLHKKRA